MNQHLITYAEYLEKQASSTASASKYIDRGFSGEQSRIQREFSTLMHKAAILRKDARTPEQIVADEQAELNLATQKSEYEAKYQAALDRISVEIAYPVFEKIKHAGNAMPSFFAARYHRHLPALEQMFKEKNREAA